MREKLADNNIIRKYKTNPNGLYEINLGYHTIQVENSKINIETFHLAIKDFSKKLPNSFIIKNNVGFIKLSDNEIKQLNDFCRKLRE